jgi:hypothetical protein
MAPPPSATQRRSRLRLAANILILCIFQYITWSNVAVALSTNPSDDLFSRSRRDVLVSPLVAAALASTSTLPANAANGLAFKLSQRDPSQLKNSMFNIPPGVQTYPSFLRGQWDVSSKYRGFIFPSQNIPKEKLVQNVAIPGFQKLSIAMVGDVGRELTNYSMNIDANGLEDRETTFLTSINGHLGIDAVKEVIYDAKENPNRLSIDFIPQRTRNANRIELFFNGRESELVTTPNADEANADNIFVCSEYIRQVTFGLSQEFGVARQVIGNYAHFYTWRSQPDDASLVKGNVLTAAYLDAQDPMFFDEPSKPVVVYSHDLVARRL